MNRSIKFRAFDLDTKIMYEDVMFRDGGVVWLKDGDWIPHTRLDGSVCVEVMQFTGLFDKNGKEIYEGDIVTNYYEGCKSTIEWANGERGHVGFDLVNDDGTFSSSSFGLICNNLEIIGTIHDTPPILTEGEE